MTRFPLFVLALLATLCGLGLTASQAIAAPPCSSYAGLADQDKDGFCAFVGTATATTSGWTGKVDCDDEDKTVFPGAHEIVDDGIDQDCDGVDMDLPVSDPAFARYVVNSYGGKAPNKETFVVEYDRCVAATGRCTVNDPKGRFDITDPDVNILCDVHINGGSVMGSDGVREIVSLEVASHRFPGVKAGDPRCGAFSGSTKGSVGSSSAAPKATGIGRATATKIADASAAKAVKAEAELRAKADGALSERLDKADELDEAQTVAINAATGGLLQLEVSLAAQEDALAAEATARAAADRRIEGQASAASRDAADASRIASAAASHGPLFEGYAMGGLMFGAPVNDDGNVARNAVFGGGGAGVNVGIDGEGFRANAFGQVAFGTDGSGGPANAWTAGGEYLWQLGGSPAHLGLNAGYSQRSSLVNALQTQVLGRTPMGGLSLAVPFVESNGGQHMLLVVRTDIGAEFIGMAGDSVTDSVRPAGMLTVGIGGGVGALQ